MHVGELAPFVARHLWSVSPRNPFNIKEARAHSCTAFSGHGAEQNLVVAGHLVHVLTVGLTVRYHSEFVLVADLGNQPDCVLGARKEKTLKISNGNENHCIRSAVCA